MGGAGPAATSRPLGAPLRRRTCPRIFAREKFSSTFFKRWRVLRAEPLAAIRRWRNAFYFRRIWGFGGLCKRKAPKAPHFYAHLGGGRPPRWGGGPAGAGGGPPFLFAACGRPADFLSSFYLLEFPGCRREGLSGPGPTAGLLSCAGKKVTKEARLGGLRRPPKNPREPPVETCGRSMPSSKSVAQG